jgi:hypothetical protein
MDRKPAKRSIANQAGNDPAISIANVDVPGGPLKISEVSALNSRNPRAIASRLSGSTVCTTSK